MLIAPTIYSLRRAIYPLHTRFFRRSLDSIRVVEILGRFRKQKDVLVRTRWAISHRFRHWVWLLPDNGRTKIPPVRLESQRTTPRNAHEILYLECLDPLCATEFWLSCTQGVKTLKVKDLVGIPW